LDIKPEKKEEMEN